MSVASLSITQITVQRRTITKDGWGGQTNVWTRHLDMSARVQPLSAEDRALLQQREGQVVTHRVYVSGTPDIAAEDRIKVPGKVPDARSLYVHGVRDIDLLGRFLTIDCEERHDG